MPKTKALATSVYDSFDYKHLVENIQKVAEDYKATEVTAKVSVATAKVEAMHSIGEMIATSLGYKKSAKGNAEYVERCGEDSGIGRTDAYYCVSFFSKFPDLEKFQAKEIPEKTHIGWTHVKELIDGKPTECKHKNIVVITIEAEKCEDCKKIVHKTTNVK